MSKGILFQTGTLDLEEGRVVDYSYDFSNACSEECLAALLNQITEQNWFEHPTIPSVLVGPASAVEYGGVLFAEIADSDAVNFTEKVCRHCSSQIV
jgi:hypothetical protein